VTCRLTRCSGAVALTHRPCNMQASAVVLPAACHRVRERLRTRHRRRQLPRRHPSAGEPSTPALAVIGGYERGLRTWISAAWTCTLETRAGCTMLRPLRYYFSGPRASYYERHVVSEQMVESTCTEGSCAGSNLERMSSGETVAGVMHVKSPFLEFCEVCSARRTERHACQISATRKRERGISNVLRPVDTHALHMWLNHAECMPGWYGPPA